MSDPSPAELAPLPRESDFPRHPAAWYLIGPSGALTRSPRGRRFLGRRMVFFRTEGGRAVALDAGCAHLGADLGRGFVDGEGIRCPFHHWRYGADGRCDELPCGDPIPARARVAAYPVVERDGYAFLFNGAAPLHPLPDLADRADEDWRSGGTYRYVARLRWYMNAANAFDMQHFAFVHDRPLLAPPVVDRPAPHALRNRYHARVAGDNARDRFLRLAVGDEVKISITLWGGVFFVISADYPRGRSRFLLSTRPVARGRTRCEGIVFAPRGRVPLLSRLWDPLVLAIRRRLTEQFLSEEARLLRSVRYRPGALVPADAMMADYFRWLASTAPAATAAAADHPLPQGVPA